ncbi:hypothetical protein Ciccas_005077 [Cichlidogyrus casuarinus]|uniref:Uncharacterized protein n=1 Tax=Cichlidogyrus casuarinus TaxID=1844966 RepID=A0ABD2Q9P8_9PLAT
MDDVVYSPDSNLPKEILALKLAELSSDHEDEGFEIELASGHSMDDRDFTHSKGWWNSVIHRSRIMKKVKDKNRPPVLDVKEKSETRLKSPLKNVSDYSDEDTRIFERLETRFYSQKPRKSRKSKYASYQQIYLDQSLISPKTQSAEVSYAKSEYDKASVRLGSHESLTRKASLSVRDLPKSLGPDFQSEIYSRGLMKRERLMRYAENLRVYNQRPVRKTRELKPIVGKTTFEQMTLEELRKKRSKMLAYSSAVKEKNLQQQHSTRQLLPRITPKTDQYSDWNEQINAANERLSKLLTRHRIDKEAALSCFNYYSSSIKERKVVV